MPCYTHKTSVDRFGRKKPPRHLQRLWEGQDSLPRTGVLVNVCAHSLLECVHGWMCRCRICRKLPLLPALGFIRDAQNLSIHHYVSQYSYMTVLELMPLIVASLWNTQLKQCVSVCREDVERGGLGSQEWEGCSPLFPLVWLQSVSSQDNSSL